MTESLFIILIPEKLIGMKMRLKKYRLIFLLVVLMTGLSITGWSISTHYDHNFVNGEFQKKLKHDSQIGKTITGEFSNNSPILFLLSTGLIGLLGVRRQIKKIGNSKHPDEISATEISSGRQRAQYHPPELPADK